MPNETDAAFNYHLLKLIEQRPEISQRELAAELGLSLGKINYCLKAFVSRGLVKVNNFRRSDNKRAYAYLLTPQGIEEKARVTARFFKRVETEYEALKQEVETLKQRKDFTDGTGRPPLTEICQRIVAAIKPEKVFLFGSYAWGDPHPDSDLDLFVIVTSSDQPAYRRARAVYRCLRGIGIPIDVVVQTRDEVARSSRVATSLSRKVLEQGTLLYG